MVEISILLSFRSSDSCLDLNYQESGIIVPPLLMLRTPFPARALFHASINREAADRVILEHFKDHAWKSVQSGVT